MTSPSPFDEKARSELVEEARRMGVERPERMTRVELRDEIVRRSVPEERQAEARGLFGVARSMLASVVDRGLNLPDAAKAIRGDSTFEVPVASQTPVATVTLAEIYAAQGHKARALRILEDVLREEPGHEEALRVQAELTGASGAAETPSAATREQQREALTVEAPPVAESVEPPYSQGEGESTEYVPGGFVETTGEEVETGRPPEVEESPAPPPEAETPIPTSDVFPAPVLALVLSQSEAGLSFYWELPESALDECSIDQDEGRAVARIVSFSAHGSAPERREETIILTETIPVEAAAGGKAGKLNLDRYGRPAAVRAALGWETEDGFLPLTVGRSLAEYLAEPDAAPVAERAAAQLS